MEAHLKCLSLCVLTSGCCSLAYMKLEVKEESHSNIQMFLKVSEWTTITKVETQFQLHGYDDYDCNDEW